MSLDQPSGFVKHQTVTRDAFLGGRLQLRQPRSGFRAGLDSVLLGAGVDAGHCHLLDLGSGVGTAALVALAHHRDLAATLIERDPAIAALARDNIADNGFADRAAVLELDLTAGGEARRAAGLMENGYDVVIANPPFFAIGAATQAAPDRAGARHMPADQIEAWIRRAAGCCAADGVVAFIYPASGLADLLGAMDPRFGAIHILPLLPRDGEPANRVLIRGRKGSRAPLTLLAARAVHENEGRGFAPAFEAVFRGTDRLYW